MNERFCVQKVLGSCFGCPVVDVARSERFVNGNGNFQAIKNRISAAECPPGQSLTLPQDQPRKISSLRFLEEVK